MPTSRERATKRWGLILMLLVGVLASLGSSAGCASRKSTTTPSSLTASQEATLTVEDVVTTAAEEPTAGAKAGPGATTFAIIGDYGVGNHSARTVADLVTSMNPGFVITTGDNYYSGAGGTGTGKYDQSTGAYYGAWLKDISTIGSLCPVGAAAVNSFFPTMGNHDYTDATPSPDTYLTYFNLPGSGFANSSGSERYYDYVQGPIHFFVLDSNTEEPDGAIASSVQAQWLQRQLAASTSHWNIVYEHHPPYSSDAIHGSTPRMQWPFAEWGADAVISGHVHTYERIARDGIVYFVNGLGGETPPHPFATPVEGSSVRLNGGLGAQKVTATDTTLDFEFFDINSVLLDSCRLTKTPASSN